jgi:hypothetical protein
LAAPTQENVCGRVNPHNGSAGVLVALFDLHSCVGDEVLTRHNFPENVDFGLFLKRFYHKKVLLSSDKKEHQVVFYSKLVLLIQRFALKVQLNVDELKI